MVAAYNFSTTLYKQCIYIELNMVDRHIGLKDLVKTI